MQNGLRPGAVCTFRTRAGAAGEARAQCQKPSGHSCRKGRFLFLLENAALPHLAEGRAVFEKSIIDGLVANPSEGLNVELKRWLDPTQPAGMEKIVKGVIALRNSNNFFMSMIYKE